MEDPDTAVDEQQELQDVRERFHDFLWHYAEATRHQADQTPDSNEAEVTYPYRCGAMWFLRYVSSVAQVDLQRRPL